MYLPRSLYILYKLACVCDCIFVVATCCKILWINNSDDNANDDDDDSDDDIIVSSNTYMKIIQAILTWIMALT